MSDFARQQRLVPAFRDEFVLRKSSALRCTRALFLGQAPSITVL